MSDANANQTLVVCPNDDGGDDGLIDTMAIVIGVLTLIGSAIAYFVQQCRDRNDADEAKRKEDADFDREQALDRVRKQLSIFIGPMHRLYKTQNTVLLQFQKESGCGVENRCTKTGGVAYWMKYWPDDFLQQFIEDPQSFEAVMHRNFVSRRLKPIYTRIRELVLSHMSDLADMPTQKEWLERYTEKDIITSPYVGSMNINVIFDTYTAWTLEFDDIVESWAEGDFRRMQPTITVPMLICNDLIDLLYDNAKAKEARYNRHVTIHKNTIQKSLIEMVKENTIRDHWRDLDVIQEYFVEKTITLSGAK